VSSVRVFSIGALMFAIAVLLPRYEPLIAAQIATAPDVLPLAQKTVDAIRNKDAALLIASADPAGVCIGFDCTRMSVARFKRQLAEKRGVYCTIFDAACLQIKGGSSLRDVLGSRPVTLSISKIEDAPQEVAVAVRNSGRPSQELFVLIYRRVNGRWALQQIEYS